MKKGLVQVFIANIVFLFISLGTNLLLPKFLTVGAYSEFKTYGLFLSYAGFFHFGYNDGMYLKYGGKTFAEIEKDDFNRNFYSYVFLELAVSVLVTIIGYSSNNKTILAFGFGLFATNIIGYFKSFYQSIGEFKLYGTLLNFEKILLLAIYTVLLLIIKTDNALIYIWSQISVGLLIGNFLLSYIIVKYNYLKKIQFSLQEIAINIKNGFILMLGNFTNELFTGIDRWFVKLLMTSADFAIYSFAVSMENMVNVLVTPISITLYNDFAKNHKIEHIIRTKKIVLLWGPLIISVAFPCKWILDHYLSNYIEASNIIFLLFSTQVFYVIIKGVYVNYYKVYEMQKKYLLQVIIMTLVAIVTNSILYLLLHSIIAIASATLFTSFVWFFVCERSDSILCYSTKEIFSLLLCIVTFIVCGIKFNAILGLVIYLFSFVVYACMFLRSNCQIAIEFFKDKQG